MNFYINIFIVIFIILSIGCSPEAEMDSDKNSPNVLLITIDTLRADRVGYVSGKDLSKTPNIDAIASNGIVFNRAYSLVPLTLPSHSTIFTGLHPLQLGLHLNVPVVLSPKTPTFTTILKNKGYQTIAAISSEILSSRTGINQGFKFFNDPYKTSKKHKIGGRIAAETVDAALDLLQNQNQNIPVFLWVHLYDPHDPYSPPKQNQVKGESLYDGEVRYADEQIGRLIYSWNKFCKNNDNIVIITSDHGEGLGEHNEKFHGYFLFDTTLHVPLIIAGSKIKPEVRNDIVSLYDICPTVLNFCNAKIKNKEDSPAINLFSNDKRKTPVLSETRYPEVLNMNISRGYAIRQNNLKLICQPNPIEFNLLNDPNEIKPIYTNNFKLSELLIDTVEFLSETQINGDLMDSDTISMITSLGYIGSSLPENNSIDFNVFPHTNWISPSEAASFINCIETVIRLPKKSKKRANIMMDFYHDNPENIFVIKWLACNLSAKGKYDEAVKFFDKININSVYKPKMLYDMTLAYAKQNRKSNAFICANLAIKKCPDSHFSFQAMAIANVGAGKLNLAKSNAWDAVALAPKNISAWNNFGLINNILKDYDQAYNAFSKSMALTRTNNQKSIMSFGKTCFALKKLDQAKWAFNNVIKLNPNNESAKIFLKKVEKLELHEQK